MRSDTPTGVFVTSLSPRSSGEEICVAFEIRCGENSQKSSFLISASQYLEIGLSVGESTMEAYDATEHAAEIYVAVKRGLFILGYGSASQKRLTQKLVSKGFSRDIALEAVEIIAGKGLINEYDEAVREVERCVAKLWGKKRIASALYEKGYGESIIREVLSNDSTDFESVCLELLRRKYDALPTERAAMQKLYAELSRYGYSTEEIKSVISRFDK